MRRTLWAIVFFCIWPGGCPAIGQNASGQGTPAANQPSAQSSVDTAPALPVGNAAIEAMN